MILGRPCRLAQVLYQTKNSWNFYKSTSSQESFDKDFILATLKACSDSKSLDFGKEVHRNLTSRSQPLLPSLANALVNMYGKCGSMTDAYSIFQSMSVPDVVSWNSLIFGYAVNGQPSLAVQLLSTMEMRGCRPNARTYVAVLVACSKLAEEESSKQVDGRLVKVNSLELAGKIHFKVASSGSQDIYVATALINLYSNCGNMLEARRVFHRMPEYNVVSWSALIQGLAENDESELALHYFESMQAQALEPDGRTYVAALVACTGLLAGGDGKQADEKVVNECLSRGKAIHSQITGPMDIFIASTLVNFYSKCGALGDAKLVFDSMVYHDVASWNTLILGYVENGEYEPALKLYTDMKLDRCAPDARTVIAALMACGSLAAREDSGSKLVKLKSLEKGMEVHAQVAEFGLSDDFFVASSLVDMYSECGSMVDASRVFERMEYHDVVSWTALILGHAETGDSELALQLFQTMKDGDCVPNELTHVAALVACGSLVKLKDGKLVHRDILRYGYEDFGVVGSSLVDFYSKCGIMDRAEHVFISGERRSLVTWSALIGGYSRQGYASLVFEHFERMSEEGVKPNGVTILSVLTACSHAGTVDKGRKLFESMFSRYGVTPEIDHYRCMVDILSRANKLEDALTLARDMPFEADGLTWNTILGGCCKWKNVEIGKLAFECLLKVDLNQTAAYTLMGNIYGSVGLWKERAKILALLI